MIMVTFLESGRVSQNIFEDNCYIVQQPEFTGFTKEHLVIAKDSDGVCGYSIVSVYAPGAWTRVDCSQNEGDEE